VISLRFSFGFTKLLMVHDVSAIPRAALRRSSSLTGSSASRRSSPYLIAVCVWRVPPSAPNFSCDFEVSPEFNRQSPFKATR
jgi:hypothetical protein